MAEILTLQSSSNVASISA